MTSRWLRKGGVRMTLQALVWLPVLASYLVTGEVVAQPMTLYLERSVDPAEYTPGQDLVVTLTIRAEGSGTLTALGGEEFLPGGWQFKETLSVSSPAPPIIPGKTPGKVEWAYISIPALPIRFSYRVTTTQGSQGNQQITGKLLYRLTGDEIRGPEVVTSIPQKQSGPSLTLEQIRALLLTALSSADTDGNGYISFAEASVVVSGITQDIFNQLDQDGDGQLSPVELGLAFRRGCGCLTRFTGKQPGLTSLPWSDFLVILSGLLGLAMAAARR